MKKKKIKFLFISKNKEKRQIIEEVIKMKSQIIKQKMQMV